jgi:hypothetical protein
MNKKPSHSLDRNQFTKNSRKMNIIESNPADLDEKLAELDIEFKTYEQQKLEQEQDSEWQKNNLEWDLRTTDWILNKVRGDKTYAQNLYAALCNNDFIKKDTLELLLENTWSCSWRYAGGIIADMLEEGDYIDWYCSGSRLITTEDGAPGHEITDVKKRQYVSESMITKEISGDLDRLGWLVATKNLI